MSQAAATDLPVPPEISPEHTLSAAEWGMASFLLSEAAFFGTLIVTYIAFMGRDISGPTPADALSLPLVIVSTLCLLSSSLVIHAAEKALHRDRTWSFCLLWAATIALGIVFLVMTGVEWHDLITNKQLTIGRNLFGTTYYTLVGFHGLHVSVGVLVMMIVLGLAMAGQLTASHRMGIRLVAWYWHFVDVVWIVVFLVVYGVSRSGGL
jgi:cytochrome c oxidase subunit 3/cytochrome o ubiquinol oxidase subunit 3